MNTQLAIYVLPGYSYGCFYRNNLSNPSTQPKTLRGLSPSKRIAQYPFLMPQGQHMGSPGCPPAVFAQYIKSLTPNNVTTNPWLWLENHTMTLRSTCKIRSFKEILGFIMDPYLVFRCGRMKPMVTGEVKVLGQGSIQK